MSSAKAMVGRLGTVIAAVGAAISSGAAIPVFRNGQALLPVLVAADAAPEERAAADELGNVLGKMSGLIWPVHLGVHPGERGFHVGRNSAVDASGPRRQRAADLLAPQAGEIGPDGFCIWSGNSGVFLEGATPEATGFAVAWLLQREGGVRWYAPGAAGEIIPHRTEWTLPELNLVREPAYVSRTITGLRTPAEMEWARHNGWRSRLEFTHALDPIFPKAIIAAHLDWAPQLQGQRYYPASSDDHNWQPNLALPAVAEHAAQVAAAAFACDPGRPSFSLGMNDTVRFDQSTATRTLVEPLRYFRGRPDYSPLVFTFMNRAAESLAQTNPDHYLGCLAYFWCENTPPFPVNPRVIPFVTTDRTQYYDGKYRAADLALMSRWGTSGVRAFGLWEYAYGQNFLIPREPLGMLAESVREGWHRGARGYLVEAGPQWGFDTFKVWMLARLLWEPDRSIEELANDFYPGYYGVAAGPMRRFFERCEALWMAQPGPPHWLKFYQQEDQSLLFPLEACRELRALLTEAARAADDPAVAARVAQTSRAFAVTEAYVAFDTDRQNLGSAAMDETADLRGREMTASRLVHGLVQAKRHLAEVFEEACRGESPAMAQTDLAPFVRNDPVPRLLWLAGQSDRAAPRRILKAAGSEAEKVEPWRALTDALASGQLLMAPSLIANGSFDGIAPQRQEPVFLYPKFGALPADWEIRAMPTETGKVALIDFGGDNPRHAVRIEGEWDLQLYQWLPAEPGLVYVVTAQLRGHSSPGVDAALFLKFHNKAGKFVGTPRMQSMPKGLTPGWRSMALADLAPEGTAWVGVGIGASRQVAGDWLEVGGVELRGARGGTGP